MSQHFFLVEPQALKQKILKLSAKEAMHARKVLRLRFGDEVWLVDGITGYRARARITKINTKLVVCQVIEVKKPLFSPRPRLILCLGLLKASAMNFLAVKLTELAVDEIRPFISMRTVPYLKNPNIRVKHWQDLASQSLKQCKAIRIPTFYVPQSLDKLLQLVPSTAARLLFYEKRQDDCVIQFMSNLKNFTEVWALVGPEGGFELDEVKQARAIGFKILNLGSTILRAETASLAISVLFKLGVCVSQQPHLDCFKY